MGLTTVADFAAGDKAGVAAKLTALKNNVVAINGFVAKTADESVTSSTTLQNDNHLAYTIGATGTYVFEVVIFGTSAANAAGDIKVGFSFPTGTCRFAGSGPDPGLASGSVQSGEWFVQLSATSGSTAIGYGLSTSTVRIVIEGTLAATATGTLQLMWAQASSSGSASTVKEGSYMRVAQVA